MLDKSYFGLTFDPQTLVELLRWRSLQSPDQNIYTFLQDGETESDHLTYGQLDEQARAIAQTLKQHCAPKSRALLLYGPGLEFISAFFGCLYAGVIAVPVYPPDPARLDRTLPRLLAIAQDAQPTVALTTAPILAMAEYLFAEDDNFKQVRWLATDKIRPEIGKDYRDMEMSGQTLAFLQYTSGSTAAPKGVMVSHSNLLHNLSSIFWCFEHSQQSRGVIWLPLYHDMGLIGGVLQPLYGNFPVVLMSPISFLQKPLSWLHAISRYHATSSGGPNFAYELCARKVTAADLETLDLSRWSLAFNGAEPIRPESINRFSNTFGGCGFRKEAFYPCYGLAEATLIVSGGSKAALPVVGSFSQSELIEGRVSTEFAGAEDLTRLVSSGKSLSDQRLLIVDPVSLIETAPEQIGEIWLQGASVAMGYWGKPDETEKSFKAYLAGGKEGPYLRTGDLGFIKDGELFVTGRLKDLIIIRGRNHYPQDIELTVENCHPLVRRGCSAAFSVDNSGQEQLAITAEIDQKQIANGLESLGICEQIAGAIREAVVRTHELHVYAVLLLRSGSIPKTSSGKIQRHACQQGFNAQTLETLYESIISSRTGALLNLDLTREKLLAAEGVERLLLLEEYIRQHIARALKISINQVSKDQLLSHLGLDSLMAIELKNQFELDLSLNAPIASFLENITISQFATQMLTYLSNDVSNGSTTALPILKKGITEAPLSFEQERLWFVAQLNNNRFANNVPGVIALSGRLDIELLTEALNEIVCRHEILRTSIITRDGLPYQSIRPASEISLTFNDLSERASNEQASAVTAEIERHCLKLFNFATGPLYEFTLLRLNPAEHKLIVVFHHIIADGWSIALFINELSAHYRAKLNGKAASLPEITIQYADFVNWQRQRLQTEELQTQIEYWQNQFVEAPSQLQLATDYPRPKTQRLASAGTDSYLSPQLTSRLRELSRQEGVTVFMLMLAAYQALLYHFSHQTDIIVGSPVSGRIRPEISQLIGFFAYPVAMRTKLTGNPNFTTLLNRVRETTLGAYANQDVPFAKVVEVVRPKRHTNYTPIFQVMFSFIKKPAEKIVVGDLSFQLDNINVTTDFDLFLTVFDEQRSLRLQLSYNTDLFKPETAEMLLAGYQNIIEQVVANPQLSLNEISFEDKFTAFVREKCAEIRDQENRTTLTVAATFDVKPIESALSLCMEQLSIPAQIKFPGNNQVFQQLLDTNSLLLNNRDGFNILLLRFEDWQRRHDRVPNQIGLNLLVVQTIQRKVNEVMLALKAALHRADATYLLCICPPSVEFDADEESRALCYSLEQQVIAELTDVAGLLLITSTELRAAAVGNCYQQDSQGNLALTKEFAQVIAEMIGNKILEHYLLEKTSNEEFAQILQELDGLNNNDDLSMQTSDELDDEIEG